MKKRIFFFILIATIAFSSMEVVLKLIAGEVNPVQLTLARFSIGFGFSGPGGCLHPKEAKQAPGPEMRGLFRPAGPDRHCHLHADLSDVHQLYRVLRGGGPVSCNQSCYLFAFMILKEPSRGAIWQP